MKVPITSAETVLNAWLASLQPGEAQSAGALSVVPLYANSPHTAFSYLTLSQAHAQGKIRLTEKPDASVPTLLLVNNAPEPILMLDGEEVVGGRQNRVLNATVLVGAQSTFELDVTCVEQGRWHTLRDEAFAPGETVYPSLRQTKAAQTAASLASNGVARPDQGAVWNEIASMHTRRGTQTHTHAMHDIYVDVGEALQRAEDALRLPPEDDAVGVVAIIGGRALCADIFDRASTLRAYWSSLVRSYALEADTSVGHLDPPMHVAQAHAAAAQLLASAVGASKQSFPSSGLGIDVRVAAADVLGAALVHHAAAVHVALFATHRNDAGSGSVARPSARARRLQVRST